MRKPSFGIAILVVLMVFLAGSPIAVGSTTKNYVDVTLHDWEKGNFPEIWDLTMGDLTLSYRVDMSAIESAGWSAVEVGLREVGAPNLDPSLKGGWMQSNYRYLSSDNYKQDKNDFHLLRKHWLYTYYDATDPNTLVRPFMSHACYGFWFDRTGVSLEEAKIWGNIDGATYNTSGVYDIVITYHALDATTATMFATINGIQQGFYISGWKNAEPEFYPAGRSFTGDMTQMQVFYGRGGGGGGSVTLSDITVNGIYTWTEVDIDIQPSSEPNSLNPTLEDVVQVAVLTTGYFDAGTVDPKTVVFAGAKPVEWHMEDVDGDGDMDMLFHFNTQELNLDITSTEATLTGDTTDGRRIRGTDTLRIVPKWWSW